MSTTTITIGEFFNQIYQTDNTHAQLLIDDWREHLSPEAWKQGEDLPITREGILHIRNTISSLFARRLAGICTEALYDRVQRAHVSFIMEFDEKARLHGFLITEKRACVTVTEVMREAGLIQVTKDGVNLTPKGIAVADEVRRQIEGQD